MEYAIYIPGDFTHDAFLIRWSPVFRLLKSNTLTNSFLNLLFHALELLHLSLYTIAITIDTGLLNF